MQTMIREWWFSIASGSALAVLLLAGCAGEPGIRDDRVTLSSLASVRQVGGIAVESIRLSAGGLMLDLRYRIIDPVLATETISRKTPLTIIDQATGTVLSVPNMPKVGKLRQIPQVSEEAKSYWMFFNNPGGLVKAGGRVTLVVGELRLRDLVVE